MKLTERQETMVAQFLHQSDRAISGLSPVARAQTLQQIKNRLRTELHTLEKGAPENTPSDDDVIAVLHRCRVTATGWQQPMDTVVAPTDPQPDTAREGEAPSEPRVHEAAGLDANGVAEEGAIWLGVCMYLADRMDQDVRLMRGVFVVLGLLTGPGALIAYLALYAERCVSRSNVAAPKPDREKLLRATMTTLGVTVGLYILGLAASLAAHTLYGFLVGGALILGRWGWMDARAGLLFLGAMFTLVPLAALAALPVQNKWDVTLDRIVKLGVALYAAVVCLGIASIIVRTALLCVLELRG